MTLGCLMVDVAGRSLLPEDRAVLEHPLVGGVILFTRNYDTPEQLAALVAEIRAVRSPPLLVAVDHEGGRVQRFRPGFTLLPPMRRIGRESDMDRTRGRALARGVSEVIGDRALHADPSAVAELAGAVMAGMREAGMSATAKHFPGHGAVVLDSHVALPLDQRPYVDLDAELVPYRRLIANGLASVMMAHVVFSEVDALPASLSRRWVTDVLRGELGFQGAVFTDDLSMGAAAAGGDIVERSRLALAAGCDMLLVCNNRADTDAALDRLKVQPAPASNLRLVRMRGRERLTWDDLRASPAYGQARQVLARLTDSTPTLSLTAGRV